MSEPSDEYDEDDYDQLNDCTFGNSTLKMDQKGFSFVNANEKYKDKIKSGLLNSHTSTMSNTWNNDMALDQLEDDIVLLKNISLNENETNSKSNNEQDKIAPYRSSLVDQFFLWINPQQMCMLSDVHNMNCRKKKLFNYTHIIPTLEDKMLNRIKLKFHPSKYLFGVDMASFTQLFQRKLIECSSLIPFNCDYYYWEYMSRLNPRILRLNRMLIADDMWLPSVQSTFIPYDQICSRAIRPLFIKYEDTLGCVSVSSVQFPRKTLSCNTANDDNINQINNPSQFTNIQKRYYVLSLIDKVISLVIDYEIKSRVIFHQLQTNILPEYKPDVMTQFQNSLGEFVIKLTPVYPFILNYTQGINMFIRSFYLLSNIHKGRASKGLYEALISDKMNLNELSNIFNNTELVNIIIFGLGDIAELENHIKCLDYFTNVCTAQFYLTIFFWKFMEMVLTWLVPFCYSNQNLPPLEYTLRFLLLLPNAIKTTQTSKPTNNMPLILSIQHKIIRTIKTTNFNARDTMNYNKKINDAKNIILKCSFQYNN